MSASRRDFMCHGACACLSLTLTGLFRAAAARAPDSTWDTPHTEPNLTGAGEPRPTPDKLEFLPAGAVTLSGYLERYIQLSLAKWSKGVVPYRALAGFFRNGRPNMIWQGRSIEMFATGEMWGKAVRSAALFYRYTGDPDLKIILQQAVTDLLSTRRENGTISCSPVDKQPDGPGGDLWERAYVLLGLDEYYAWVEPDPAVLKAMIEEADATLAQVGPPPKKRIVDLGWSEGLVGGNNIESSTLLEPMMRLYRRTGYDRYLAFARYIVETEGGAKGHDVFAEVLAGRDPKDVGGAYPKAYEMLSLFEGLVEYYRVTGNERWHAASLKLFQRVMEKEITLIGNGGGDQPYHPKILGEAWDNTALEQTNTDVRRMMETCTGVTWLKYCSQILRLTGDPQAVDYIERYAYNGLIGAMKPEGDGFSYVNLLNGIKTDRKGWGTDIDGVYMTCCNLNGPEGLAYLPLVALMQDADGPVINLYNSCTARCPIEAHTVGLTLTSRYPVDGEVRIEVAPSAPCRFAIKLRIPIWSVSTRLRVNGRSIAAAPGTYARIERRWSGGDIITLTLDMRAHLVKAPRGSHEGSDRYCAVVRGPIVLARDENIDPHFAEPVNIPETDGVVAVRPTKPTLETTNMQFEVRTRAGVIPMVDYASVNSWEGKQVQTWLPLATTGG